MSKLDKSILRMDQTLDHTEIRSRKKKRVSFSESVKFKTISTWIGKKPTTSVEGDIAFNDVPDQNCENKPSPVLNSGTPREKSVLTNLLSGWESKPSNNKRLSFLTMPNDEPNSFEPLTPKLTSSRHMSFYVDPNDLDDENIVMDEHAYKNAEISMLNATVQASTKVFNATTDDFAQFLREESGRLEEDMDISDAIEGQTPPVEELLQLQKEKQLRLEIEEVEENTPVYSVNQSCASVNYADNSRASLPPSGRTYIVGQNESHEAQGLTYTVVHDQSTIHEPRREELDHDNDSWNQPSILATSQISDLSAIPSKRPDNFIQRVQQTEVPVDHFNSPLRKDRRRTFVQVHRSQEREMRREKLFKDRPSMEPMSIQALNSSVASIIEPKVTGGQKEQELPPSQSSQSKQRVYKYTLPDIPNYPEARKLVSFFLDDESLHVNSFKDALDEVMLFQDKLEPEIPPWQRISNDGPSTPRAILPTDFTYTPASGDKSHLSMTDVMSTPSVDSTPGVESYSKEVDVLIEKFDQLEKTMDAVNNSRLFPTPPASCQKPPISKYVELILSFSINPILCFRRLSQGVEYQAFENYATWKFCSRVLRVMMVVENETATPRRIGISIKQTCCGQWTSKLAEISLHLISIHLGVSITDAGIEKSQEVTSEKEIDGMLLSLDEAVNAANLLTNQIIMCCTKKLFFDPSTNLQLVKPHEDSPYHLVMELSAFPVFCILPKNLELSAKVCWTKFG